MIITCPNCKKQFKIDNSLISDDGRDLQCGSCNYVWFYKVEDKNETPLTLKENISENKVDTDIDIKDGNLKFSKKLKQEKIIKPKIKKEISSKEVPETIKKSSSKGSKFFSYLIVFIVSFVALIILLDTLKTPLINVFPGLEIILFNLFETLQDIKLFIIDLY